MIKKELLLASWLEKLQKKWDNEEYYYDVEEATKVFKFVSKLTNDRGASRQFELLEFQFEIITEILCVKRRSDGKRKHREAHINIPRKNGKSFLAAIIVVYLFFCQRHIFGALFILTASVRANGNTELLEVRSMEILKLILENWLIFVIVVALLGLTVYAVLRFLKLTPQQQLDKIRIALLYMVTEAEKELKRKTGQVKRAMVWDWLVERFPIITCLLRKKNTTNC